MIRGRLFTRYWLDEGIQGTDEYRALSADRVVAFALEAGRLWAALERMAAPSEAETESEFVYPILDRLGWHRLPQQTPGRGRRDIADELLFTTGTAKSTAQRLADKTARFRHGAVVVENEARDTVLDRAKGKTEAPSNQILRYLKRSDGIPGSTVRWGLLTNGRFWRLYFADARARDEDFIEIELAALLGPLRPPVPDGADEAHWPRVFMLLFGRDAFVPTRRAAPSSTDPWSTAAASRSALPTACQRRCSIGCSPAWSRRSRTLTRCARRTTRRGGRR